MSRIKFDYELQGVCGRNKSLCGKTHLYQELIEWLRDKELSVRQAQDLLSDTKNIIDAAWHTEELSTKL